jgi:hypothetical protein
MRAPVESKPRSFGALWRSYAADLKGWAAGLAAGYGIAAALLLGGILAVFGAITVGAIALFHFIALKYGTDIGFAVLGGGLLLLGVILLLVGLGLMKRRVAPLPRPHRQVRAAGRMLAFPTVSRAVGALSRSDAAKPDATTQVLIGAAAILAVGWIVLTRLGSTQSAQVRR